MPGSDLSAKCKNLFIALNAYLNRGLSAADKDYEKWCNIINSGTGTEEYPIAIISGSMREWIGERIINQISAEKMTVRNRDYEHTEQISRNDIEDDKYGFFGPVFQEMGINAGNLWSQLATEALCNPGNWADGNPFFGSRKFGKATINNTMETAALTFANYETARKRMMGFQGADGKPLRLVPDTVMVGPDLEGTARTLFEAELVNDGQNATVSNIHKGECSILVNNCMVGDYANYWFLFCTTRGYKPVVVQKRKEGALQRHDSEDCDNVIMNNVNLYSLHYRGAAFASMPHLVIGGFATA